MLDRYSTIKLYLGLPHLFVFFLLLRQGTYQVAQISLEPTL